MTGKGPAPRPLSVSDEEFGKRFDAIDWSDRGQAGCAARLANGQWCGETDPQQYQFTPSLCTDCGGELLKAAP